MHKNELTQKKVWQANSLGTCPLKSGWLTYLLEGGGGWSKREYVGHKRTKQRGKVETISLKYGSIGDGVENIYNIHM
jgi:hypothetical protein